MARDIRPTHDFAAYPYLSIHEALQRGSSIASSATSSGRAKINIYDKSLYEIVTIDGFGDRAALSAFKVIYGETWQSLEDFLVALTLAQTRDDGMAWFAMQPCGDGFNDIRTNIVNLREAYAALSQYFPADELENIEGFVRVMLRNSDPDLQSRYNGFREKLIIVRDHENGEIVGGTNFGIYLGDNAAERKVVTAQDSYVFVTPNYRRMGVAGALSELRFMESHFFAAQCGYPDVEVIAFSEQNNPLKMTAAQYARDCAMAIDPVDRLKAWQRVGCMRLDFTYIQPALGEDQEAVEILDLHTHIEEDLRFKYAIEGLDAAIVKEHLRMFVELSVLKEEGTFSCDPHCRAMAAELDGMDKVALIGADLPPLQAEIYSFFLLLEEGAFLRRGRELDLLKLRLGELFMDEQYGDLIAARNTRLTAADIAYIKAALRGSEVARTAGHVGGEGDAMPLDATMIPVVRSLEEMATA